MGTMELHTSQYNAKVSKDQLFTIDNFKESHLKTYFNLLYYLLLIPFKVLNDKKSGIYVIQTNKLQQFGCGFAYFSMVVTTAAYFVINSSRFFVMTSDISQLLATIGNISGSIMVTLATKVIWQKQHKLLKFLELSRVGSVPCRKNVIFTSPRKLKCLVVAVTLGMYAFQLKALWWDIKMDKTVAATNAWVQSFIGNNISSSSNVLLIFVAIFYSLGYITYLVPRLLLVFILLQLKCVGLQFEQFLKKKETKSLLSVEQVRDEYDSLRNTVQCVNSWAGEIFLFIYICLVAFLASLPEILRSDTATKLTGLSHIVYCGLILVFLFVGCDLPHRVKVSCRKWITAKRRQVGISQEDKLSLLAFAEEIDCGEPIGLSCPFFTVTYNFLGSMIGLLTTYGVVVFQMHK